MSGKFNQLPPLGALRGFEAAARLGSFSRAAEEQNMTQSAISHQVKSLENYFGQPLFFRSGRTVELSDAGKDFLETAQRSLAHLARGSRRLDSYMKPGQALISTTSAFAAKWLIPRYDRLGLCNMLIEPWVHASNLQDEFEYSELEIGIWRGTGDWPGLTVVKLFDDWITPVCAPKLLQNQGDENTPMNLPGLALLHDERTEDWGDWFNEFGVDREDAIAGYNFNDPGLLLDCAIAGHGVALGSLVLAENHINDGSLVRLFPFAKKTSESYFVVCSHENLTRPEVKCMWDWIIQQGGEFQEKNSVTVGQSKR